jgi:hypothetical protein
MAFLFFSLGLATGDDTADDEDKGGGDGRAGGLKRLVGNGGLRRLVGNGGLRRLEGNGGRRMLVGNGGGGILGMQAGRLRSVLVERAGSMLDACCPSCVF